jgi:hypothetical protein
MPSRCIFEMSAPSSQPKRHAPRTEQWTATLATNPIFVAISHSVRSFGAVSRLVIFVRIFNLRPGGMDLIRQHAFRIRAVMISNVHESAINHVRNSIAVKV